MQQETPPTIAQILQDARGSQTRAAVALKAGVDRGNLVRYGSGTYIPRLSILRQLCNALGIPWEAAVVAYRNSRIAELEADIVAEGSVPRKIHELRTELQQVGCQARQTKGFQEVWKHPLIHEMIYLVGHDSDKANRYQEKAMRAFLDAIRNVRKEGQ